MNSPETCRVAGNKYNFTENLTILLTCCIIFGIDY